MGIARGRGHRRILALMQLVLFVFSTSTMLLPCASTNERVAGAAPSIDQTHSSHATTSDAPGLASHTAHHTAPPTPSHHAPGAPTSSDGCPWVVGCVGIVQFALDDSWRVLEYTPVSLAPAGVTLQRATVDRDVESPPPRV